MLKRKSSRKKVGVFQCPQVQGIVVDAWFTGFAEYEEKEVYFCVYLGQKEDRDVSSAAAREIAVQILSEEPGFKGTVLDENM